MRVLLITQLFDPENAIKGLSFTKGLVALGHEVVVVTTFPSYPAGRIYPGYRMRWLQVEELDGVRVVRLPSYISHGGGALKRLAGYASFSFMAFFYSLFALKRPDVIYSYYPPVIGGLAAAALSVLKRTPMIYDVQDLWPEAVVATGMVRSRKIVTAIETLVGWVYRRANAIVVLSDGYKRALISKGVPEEKIHRVYNWSDESRLNQSGAGGKLTNSFFDIVYAGNLGKAQALHFVIQAAVILQHRADNKIRFVFIGDGVEKTQLEELVADQGLSNVIFKERVAPEKIGAELECADALLVHLADSSVFSITVPQKTQAYMAAGKPILMGVAGESADLVRKSHAGVVVRPCDPLDIAKGALVLANTPVSQLASFASSAKSYYLKNMSQANGVARISQILHLVAPKADAHV